MLDLCILPCNLSADMCVVDVRAGGHVHRALAVWVHPGTVGVPNIPNIFPDIVG